MAKKKRMIPDFYRMKQDGEKIAFMKQYVSEVRASQFPEDEHCFHMLPGELEKFQTKFN